MFSISCLFLLLYREINFHESTCWALVYTLGTHATLVEVDISHIVLNGDGIKLADFLALTASDTSNATSLLGYCALVVIDTLNIHTTTLRTLLAKLNDVAWTSLGTGTTASTLLLIHLGKTCLGIDRDGTELTGSHTVATAQTAKTATCLACSTRVHSCTGMQTIILGDARTMLARAITTHYCHLRIGVGHGDTQEIGYLAHHVGTTYRTHQSFDAAGISSLDQSCCHTGTSGKAATTTIGTRQNLAHLT